MLLLLFVLNFIYQKFFTFFCTFFNITSSFKNNLVFNTIVLNYFVLAKNFIFN